MEVTARTLADPEHDRPSRTVRGELVTRRVEALSYTQYLVNGQHVDPESVEPITENANPDQPRDEGGRWTATGANQHTHESGATVTKVGSKWYGKHGGEYTGISGTNLAKVQARVEGYVRGAGPARGAPAYSPQETAGGTHAAAVRASILREIAGADPHLGVDLRSLHGKLQAAGHDVSVEDMHQHVLGLQSEGKLGTDLVTRHEGGLLHSKYTIGTGYKNKHGEWSEQIGYVRPVRNYNPDQPVVNWTGRTSPERLLEFQRWLADQTGETLTGRSQEKMWTDYIKQGWMKGAGRAYDEVNKAKPKVTAVDQVLYEGGKRQVLSAPVSRERIDLMASRTFDEMEDVDRDMRNRMGRALVDGLIEGQSPKEVASALIEVTNFSMGRAERVARTEIMSAHAEGQLDAFDQMGVQELGVQAEISTSGKGTVCDECAALEGETFTIEEARGVLPVHPCCECVWIPNTEGT